MSLTLKRKTMTTKPRKFRALNTTTEVLGNTTHVTLFNTVIVRFTRDKVWLDTGGYKTVTTKSRMNSVSDHFDLGFHVGVKKGKWSVWSYRIGISTPFGPDGAVELRRWGAGVIGVDLWKLRSKAMKDAGLADVIKGVKQGDATCVAVATDFCAEQGLI
jgi:hypothetical protein